MPRAESKHGDLTREGRLVAYDYFYAECAKKAHGDPFLLHELLRGKRSFSSHEFCDHEATTAARSRCRKDRARADKAATVAALAEGDAR